VTDEEVEMSGTRPTQDERIMAALAHACAVLFGMGIVGAIVIWVTQKEKSRSVAFQALQATVYQGAGLVVQLVIWGCWLTLYLLSFIPLMSAPDEPPLFFLATIVLMLVPLGLLGLWIVGGLWGAVRTLQGREFHYAIIGQRLEHWLASQ